jgi:hypothetical protein
VAALIDAKRAGKESRVMYRWREVDMRAKKYPPVSGVYLIAFPPDARVYVGESIDVFRRLREHLSLLRD